MGIKYYKRSHPTAKLILDGMAIQFTSIDGNITGYFATDNEKVQSLLDAQITAGKGGVSAIGDVEFFRDYVDKKKAGIVSGPIWRDELTPDKTKVSQSTLTERLQQLAVAPAAVASPAAPQPANLTVAEVSVNKDIAKALPPAVPFNPPVGTRKAKAKPKV